MKKVIVFVFLIMFPFLGVSCVTASDFDFADFRNIENINIYHNGEKTTIEKSEELSKVMLLLGEMFEDSREMPALGVSLDEETKKEMQSGLWLELCFDGQYIHGDLPFERLLLKVEKDIYGFNVIRYFKNEYSGRCFYFDMPSSEYMNKLQDEILCLLGN